MLVDLHPEIKEGLIDVHHAPDRWQFKEHFERDSYLWRKGGEIYISFIVARNPGFGHFSALVATIEADGFSVAIPSPLGPMEEILRRWGFKMTVETSKVVGPVNVWRRSDAR